MDFNPFGIQQRQRKKRDAPHPDLPRGKNNHGIVGFRIHTILYDECTEVFLGDETFFTLIRQNRDTGYFPMKKVKCDRIYVIFRILIAFFLLSS